MKTRFYGIQAFCGVLLALLICAHGRADGPQPLPVPTTPPIELADQEQLITLLATNDIHGGVEPEKTKGGAVSGGMAFWSGIVQSIRKGIAKRFGEDRAGVLVLDAGDQFQGTLVSNYDEGMTTFLTMNDVGYDAIVLGNHDYDFGPRGWLQDKVTPGSEDQNPRGALMGLVQKAKFPIISANTYLKNSLFDLDGDPAKAQSYGCVAAKAIDWKRAEQPYFDKPGDFLKRYIIRTVAGVRVALIGLDHPGTATITTPENVADLCFRDTAETYLELRKELEGLADVFIIIIHEGETQDQHPIVEMVKKIDSRGGPNALHAVVSGHTHQMTNMYFNRQERRIPIIQSVSGGTMFGRIDLVWDRERKALNAKKTRSLAALLMGHSKCMPIIEGEFCKVLPDKAVAYEGMQVVSDRVAEGRIAEIRKQVATLADRPVGTAQTPIRRNRISESPLADLLTDAMLLSATSVLPVDITMINSSGMREDLGPQQGAQTVTYEDLFRVLPFNNHGVVIGPVDEARLLALLNRSIRTCGSYGALMQSGLRVKFERDCRAPAQGGRNVNGVDPQAKLLWVETLRGDVIFDKDKGGLVPSPHGPRNFSIATLDFLVAGGSGYADFSQGPNPPQVLRDLGIVRESIATEFMAHPAPFKSDVDGRWKEVLSSK